MVIDFGTNGKRVYTFLLVINSNFCPILHRFGHMAAYSSIANFTYPTDPHLTPPLWGNPSEFLDDTCSQKLEVKVSES